MNSEVFLVTGAMGCIGSWVLRQLAFEGIATVAVDLSSSRNRIRLLLAEEDLSRIEFKQVDITDFAGLHSLIGQYRIDHIIHLAGLQVPFCKADPSAGAEVNVLGTINMLQLVREFREQIKGFAYASSIAVMGHPDNYLSLPVPDDVVLNPATLYGVYKQANERSARVYWSDWEVPSVALRPFIVYGVGRDQGLTSDIAKAILAAVADRAFQIKFGGKVALQYTEDVAKMFIGAARAHYRGSAICNIRNDVISVNEFVQILSEEVPGGDISCQDDQPLPFPADLDDQTLRSILGHIPHTPLRDAIRQTATMFEELLREGLIDLEQLDR